MSNNNTSSMEQRSSFPQPPADENPEKLCELDMIAFREFAVEHTDQLFHQMIQLQQQNKMLRARLGVIQPSSPSHEHPEMISPLQDLQSIASSLRPLLNEFSHFLVSINSMLAKVFPSLCPSPTPPMPFEEALATVPKNPPATSTSSSSTTSSVRRDMSTSA